MILKNVLTSCGCTTPKWSKKPILPNETGSIDVSYNPMNRPGAFKKSVTIITNCEPSKVYLTIQGKVNERERTVEEKFPFTFSVLRSQKTHVSFFNITNTEQRTSSLMVVNTTSKPIRVTFPDLPSHIKAPNVTIAAGEEDQLIFTYDATLKNDWGYVSEDIYCWVDGAKSSRAIKISATITEDFGKLSPKDYAIAPKINMSSRKVDFGTVKSGAIVEKSFTIKNTGKSTLTVHSVKSTSSTVSCKIDKKELSIGESTKVTIVLSTKNTLGRQYKVINVISNDPSAPNLTFSLSGSIER